LNDERRFQVELTQGAEDDLETIYDYVSEQRSRDEADALLDSFLGRVEALERYPRRGSIPKELELLGLKEFRQLLLSPYRIIYRVIGDTVFILLIVDGRRDMQTLLEHRLLGR
jgi:toxin ParE1/3/4